MNKLVEQLDQYLTGIATDLTSNAEIDAALQILDEVGRDQLIRRAYDALQHSAAGTELEEQLSEQASLLAKCDVDRSAIDREIQLAEQRCNREVAELRQRAEGRPEAIAASLQDEIAARLRRHDSTIADLNAQRDAIRIADPVPLLQVQYRQWRSRHGESLAGLKTEVRLNESRGQRDNTELHNEISKLETGYTQACDEWESQIEAARRSPEHRYVQVSARIESLRRRLAGPAPRTLAELVQARV